MLRAGVMARMLGLGVLWVACVALAQEQPPTQGQAPVQVQPLATDSMPGQPQVQVQQDASDSTHTEPITQPPVQAPAPDSALAQTQAQTPAQAQAAQSQAAAMSQEPDPEWPRQMDSAGWTVLMYQPQVEKFKNPNLEARAAVSVKGPQMTEAQFGAVWVNCTVSSNPQTRMVSLIDIKVTDTRFPGLSGIQVEKLIKYLEQEIPTWKLEIDLDRLLAELDNAEVAGSKSDQLNNAPPAIYFRAEPTVLVYVDGKPILREIEGSKYKYVANTPYFMIDDGFGTMYLKGGQFWYSAAKIEGPWQSVSSVPSEVTQLAQKAQAAAAGQAPKADSGVPVITTPPKVIVSTQAAELLLSDGTPEWVALEGTGLMYVKNSENDILKDLETQQTYILIAGRWYRSKSLENGPWKHVPPDQVPSEFSRIPPESDLASVRASVPGTQEARDAVLESSIPETAAVDRNKTITVTYEGEPKFDPIQGTNMKYAVNTPKSVLQISGKYYCCDEAVWYAADAPKGPWKVATSIPKEVQDIPASSPLYNTKFVTVYDTTTEVVYVAATPSYSGAYYYGGCMVYGTGYPYYPVYPAYYYPHPVTYGFGVHYNPYTGWGFAFGVSYGWLNISFSTGGYYGGYWGAAGYHNGYRHGYAHGYYNGRRAGFAAGYRYGQNNPGGRPSQYANRDGVRSSQPRASTRPSQGTGTRPSGGQAATRPSTGAGATRPSTGQGAGARPSTQPATGNRTPKAAGAANNVYTDKNGNVYRNQGGDWQKRDNSKGSWTPTGGSSPSTSNRAATTNSGRSQSSTSTQNLNRSQQARQSGASRSASRGGMSRGGGGGRRR